MPFSSVVELTTTGDAPELRRVDRLPAITLSANLGPGYDLGSAIDFIETTVDDILPLEARLGYKGTAEEFTEASSAILVTFALALVIVFLVLVAQFSRPSGYDSDAALDDKLRGFNDTAPAAKAYRGTDGNVVLQSYIISDGGIMMGNMKAQIEVFRDSGGSYQNYISQ